VTDAPGIGACRTSGCDGAARGQVLCDWYKEKPVNKYRIGQVREN
jgi:hypothetical protein